jgi:hypothetical protein
MLVGPRTRSGPWRTECASLYETSFLAGAMQWTSGIGIPLLVSSTVFCALILANKMSGRPSRWTRMRPKRQRITSADLRAAGLSSERRPPTPNIADPKEQLAAVSRVDFERRRLLNREEVPVLRLLEQTAREANAGFRVMAQTSLGEIIRPKPNSGTEEELQLAFRSINSKRIDFGIFDRFGQLVVAVEYQGSGHYRETSFMRDAVKQEALRKAGVQVLAIHEGFQAPEVLPRLRRALGMPTSPEIGGRKLPTSGRSAA